MKRIFHFLIVGILLTSSGFSAENPRAELYKKDGGAWKVFLIKSGDEKITIRLEKSKTSRPIDVAEIDQSQGQ